jgi:hypothetical protein
MVYNAEKYMTKYYMKILKKTNEKKLYLKIINLKYYFTTNKFIYFIILLIFVYIKY